jgi:hypothetical protein
MNIKTLNTIKAFAIRKYSQQNNLQHDVSHAERVVRNVVWIANKLHPDKPLDILLLQAAGYLHDIVTANFCGSNIFCQLYVHMFEKYLNKKYIGSILSRFDIKPEEKRILSVAIINHPYSVPYRILNTHHDIYSIILQDADTMDYISTQREQNIIHGKNIILSYVIKTYLSWVRKNIKSYLNFPELL